MKTHLLILSFTFILINQSFSQWWGEQTSNVTVQLTSVSVVDNYIVWVCGYTGTVLRTTNSGINWLNVSGGGIPNTVSLINIWGVDANTAITAGYTGSNTWVWKTSNAGVNWVQVFNQTGGFIDAVAMKYSSPNQGIMIGDPVGGRWSIWRTTNAGTNWDSSGMYLPQAGSEGGWNNSLCYITPRAWFGTNNTRIYYSNNDGMTWSSHSTSPELDSYAIFFGMPFGFFNPSGVSGGATLMESDDTGYTWTTLSSLGTGNFGGFAGLGVPVNSFLSLMQIYYVRSDNKIYHSFSFGTGWIVEYTAPAGNYRHISVARNGTYIWGVRTNGGITRCTCIVSGINKISEQIPKAFSLKQNFPNPFNPQTNIDFDIPKSSMVRLNVYNTLGKLVTTLVNTDLQAGSYRISWDAHELSSGIYFYSLMTRDFTETKKMILIK